MRNRLYHMKFIIILILAVSFLSCERSENPPPSYDPCNTVTGICQITGTIQKLEVTTWMYGSHLISGYALRSNSVILDDFINYNVTVIGYRIEGYPTDGGPVYIEVTDIVCDVMEK